MDLDGDPAAVVRDGHAPVLVDRDLDVLAEPHHRLVDRVVDDLVDEVVEAARVDAADVHRGPLPDRLQAFQDLDRFRVVRDGFRTLLCHLFHTVFRNNSDPEFSPFRNPSQSVVV
jgi:hypothetical protein